MQGAISSNSFSYYEQGGRVYVSDSPRNDIQTFVKKGKLKGAGIKSYNFFTAKILQKSGLCAKFVIGKKTFCVNKKSLQAYLAREQALSSENKLTTAFALNSLYKNKKNGPTISVGNDFAMKGIVAPEHFVFLDLKLSHITPDNFKEEIDLKPYHPADNQILFKKSKNQLVLSIPSEVKVGDQVTIKREKFYYKINNNTFSPTISLLPKSPILAAFSIVTFVPLLFRGMAASAVAEEKFNNLQDLIGFTVGLNVPGFGKSVARACVMSVNTPDEGLIIQLKDSSIISIARKQQKTPPSISDSSDCLYYSADEEMFDNS